MLAKLLGNNGAQTMVEKPTQMPVVQMPKRRQGEQYAAAIDEFHTLQQAHDEAVARLQDALNQIRILDGALEAVRADNSVLIRDRDYHLGLYVQMKTRLRDMKAMLQYMDSDDIPVPPAETPPQVEQALQGLEQALTEPKS